MSQDDESAQAKTSGEQTEKLSQKVLEDNAALKKQVKKLTASLDDAEKDDNEAEQEISRLQNKINVIQEGQRKQQDQILLILQKLDTIIESKAKN